jgi:hypothetical protein
MLPTARQRMLDQLTKTMTGLADKFVATTGDVTKETSVIGLLGKGGNDKSEFPFALMSRTGLQ